MPNHSKTIKSGQEASSAPGFLRRLAAQIYDIFLLVAVLFLATALLLPFTDGDPVSEQRLLIYQIYLAFISFLFYGWFWKQALLRFITAIISLAFLGLGFLWIFMNKNRYSWHDYLSKTALFSEAPKK